MKTYRLLLIGARDRAIYGIKEYEAADDEQATRLADRLVGTDPRDRCWEGQPLVTELRPVQAAA